MTDIEERILSARTTSNLKVDGVNCAAAILVASALARKKYPRGGAFNDIRGLFDVEHGRIKTNDRENIERDISAAKAKAADGMSRLSKHDTEGRTARAERLAKHIEYIHATYAASAKRAAMFGLKGAKEVTDIVEEMAHAEAFRVDSPVPVGQMRHVAWQALALFLDETCYHCDGRGFNGGYDGPQMECKHCAKYTRGKRRGYIGKSDAERSLIDRVSRQMDDEKESFMRLAAQIHREMRQA